MPQTSPTSARTRQDYLEIASALDGFVSAGAPETLGEEAREAGESVFLRRLVLLEDGTVLPFAYNNSQTFREHGAGPCELLAEPLGILIANDTTNRSALSVTTKYATVLLLLGVVPGLERILCLDGRCLMQGREHLFAEFLDKHPGIHLLYNSSGYAQDAVPLIPADMFEWNGFGEKVRYYGKVPREVAATIDQGEVYARQSKFRQELKRLVAPLIFVPYNPPAHLNSWWLPEDVGKCRLALSALTFGAYSWDSGLVVPAAHPRKGIRYLVEHVDFLGPVEEGYENPYAEPDYIDIPVLEDICQIWSSLLSQNALHLDCEGLDEEEMLDKILEHGREHGVDSAVGAYLAGAPIEHILAE